MNNIPYYPEPFFTKTFVQNNESKKEPNSNFSVSDNKQNFLGSLFNNINIDQITKLLPLFMHKKEKNFNVMELIKNISPEAEKLVTAISALGLNNKNKFDASDNLEQENENIIDISEYEETK